MDCKMSFGLHYQAQVHNTMIQGQLSQWIISRKNTLEILKDGMSSPMYLNGLDSPDFYH